MNQPLHPIVRQLRRRRIDLGMSQKRVGEICGVTPSCVTDWESGRRLPNLLTVQKWANSLDMAVMVMPMEGEW